MSHTRVHLTRLASLIIFASAADAVAAPRDIYLTFNGVNSAVRGAATELLAEGGVPLTVSAWVKPATLGTNLTFVSKGEASTSSVQWWLGRLHDNHMLFLIRSSTGQMHYAYATAATDDLNWHHVAGVFDGAAISLYVDGVMEANVPIASGAIVSTHLGVCIGRMWSSATDACGGGPPMNGSLDDVRIYLRALVQSEIQVTMSTELVGNETGLAAYYNFNDAVGQIAYDRAAGFHGILGSSLDADSADPSWIGTGPDTTKPITIVTSPRTTQVVSSPVPLTSFSLDNVGVVSVQYRLNGSNLGPELTTPPFATTLNPAALSQATHTITAVARDAAGNTSSMYENYFTVPGRISGCLNQSLGNGWTCVDSNAVSATGGPTVALSLVHGQPVPAHALIVVFADADMVTGDGTMSCTDNAGNIFRQAPMGNTTIDNGSHTVRAVSYWYVLDSKPKASQYRASCTFTTSGIIEDLDMSVMVFRHASGLPSPGIDSYLPWDSGYSAPGPCPCAIVPGGQRLTVNYAGDLILGGGNMNGGFPQVNPPFVGVDGDGVYTGAAYYTSAVTSDAPRTYLFTWYDTRPDDGRASTMFAFLSPWAFSAGISR